MMGLDWKVILAGLQIFSICITALGFVVIKFNDFKHLHNSVEELKDAVSSLTEGQNILNKEVVGIKARCEERHKD